jgi:extradiol dioxygenase family protein
VPHFGVVLKLEQFDELAGRLQADQNTRWVIEPRTRFAGEPGEQRTMFFLDPAGNALEFKAFADDAALFAV